MGGKKCFVEGCNSLSTREEDRGVTFHRFPMKAKIRPNWISNCRVDAKSNLTKTTFVCSRHFRKIDFQAFKGKKYMLKQTAVPTIFPWGSTEHKSEIDNLDTENDIQANNLENESNSNSNDGNQDTLVTADDKPKSVKRSASADAGSVITEPKKKIIRKSSDSAILKSASKKNISKKISLKNMNMEPISHSPIRMEPTLNFSIGNRIEAQDFNGIWHMAKVVEVDNDDGEVLIHFEKNIKGKNQGIFDEWITMDSSRLRPIQLHKKAAISFVVGEKCFARWSDARKFPASIQKVLEHDMYEVLFDDGYVKIVKANHMAKFRPSEVKSLPLQKQLPPLIAVNQTPKPILPTVILNQAPIKINYADIPEPPKEGEWACHWLNDAPVGVESTVVYTDGKIYKTVIVADKRLPEGWIKHVYQRSGLLAKWDILLVNPENHVYRSKTELKQHFEKFGGVYNPNIYDFSLHKRRAKELGLCKYTPEYFAVSHYKIESKPKTQNVGTSVSTPVSTTFGDTELLNDGTNIQSANDFVYVGSLKVQIIDNLFRCPKEECNKNFRKENHLQIHIKHYHEEMSKLLGVCPNMSDLAYLRTIGQPIEETIPKNHLPNVQFFEKVHQNDMQSKTTRKSISSPPGIIKQESDFKIEQDSKENINEESLKSVKVEKLDPQKLNVDADLQTPCSSSKRKYTLLEEALNSKPLFEKKYFIKQSSTYLQPTDNNPAKPPPPLQPLSAEIPQTNIDKITKSSTKKHRGTVRRKIVKSRGQLIKHRQKKLTEIVKHNLSNISHLNETFTDYDDTRHSFRSGSPESAFKRQKLQLFDSGQENTNSQNTSSIAESQSPKYINEDGEVIKIVRMRQEEIINCICSYPEEDGLMIQCELCLCWQHGICNGIERENQVPDKYVCYICRNPQRGRGSLKYKHDQEWLFEGRLPVTKFHVPNSKRAERFDILKQSHTLTGNLLELKNFLHSLRVKINIAENKDHPKMYLWSKKWETSPIRGEVSGIELLNPNRNEIKMDIKIKNEDVKSNLELTQIMQNETKTMEISENMEKSDDLIKREMKKTEESVLSGLLQTPGGTNIDFEKELEASTICQKRGTTMTMVNNDAPNIPLPEAAIDPVECQFRLLEHIQKQQTTGMSRLQILEAQIIALEAADDESNKLEPIDSYTRTKLTIQMLIKDLTAMRKLAIINSSRLYGTHL